MDRKGTKQQATGTGMQISRSAPGAAHTIALSRQVSTLAGPCVQCDDCTGLCEALIETLVLPDIILSRKKRDIR